jgi:hypothetical protein
MYPVEALGNSGPVGQALDQGSFSSAISKAKQDPGGSDGDKPEGSSEKQDPSRPWCSLAGPNPGGPCNPEPPTDPAGGSDRKSGDGWVGPPNGYVYPPGDIWSPPSDGTVYK